MDFNQFVESFQSPTSSFGNTSCVSLIVLVHLAIVTILLFFSKLPIEALLRPRCYPAAVRFAEGVWLCGGLTRPGFVKFCQVFLLDYCFLRSKA